MASGATGTASHPERQTLGCEHGFREIFDRVNRHSDVGLARVIKDERLLKLIRRYLEEEMVNGQRWQSGRRIQRRPVEPAAIEYCWMNWIRAGKDERHRFCRYADDCNIYVSSRKAGEQGAEVSQSLWKETETSGKWREKCCMRPWERKFLGYNFTWHKAPWLEDIVGQCGQIWRINWSSTTGHSTKSVETTIRGTDTGAYEVG